jgi:hypothetical protein
VLGHAHAGERFAARLGGYQRVMPTTSIYPCIVPAPERSVEGLLIMDLDSDDLRALDRYEEVEEGCYQRQIVDVQVWGCGPRLLRFSAHTYVAGPRLRASLRQ